MQQREREEVTLYTCTSACSSNLWLKVYHCLVVPDGSEVALRRNNNELRNKTKQAYST